ncbi:hypothetical protein [Burkholderia vietnamiensis]|uniref:hypothetical protein n=1 Tax=Burkholderia vietnamiensis TaxID=60552 RepID=UPI00075E0AB1|nr:hypothetical protein [Burkholderia vietnamiensis]MCA8068528.1 hypothetical protein [Burkholderia vietnamiensis]
MSDLAAAPGSIEPVIETKTYLDGASATGVAPLPDVSSTGVPAINAEAGTAAMGELAGTVGSQQPSDSSLPAAAPAQLDSGSASPAGEGYAIVQADGADSINFGAHLSRLDGMLAELERKIAAGIHTFAHEITAARGHLAKLL